jgi:hypothetical protein
MCSGIRIRIPWIRIQIQPNHIPIQTRNPQAWWLPFTDIKGPREILEVTLFYRTVMDSNREPVKVEGPPGSKVFIYQEVFGLG